MDERDEELYGKHADELIRFATTARRPVTVSMEVRDAMARLSLRERSVLYLAYWHELSVNDIARTLAISRRSTERALTDATPAGGGAIEVHHAIYEVSISATLECPTPIDTTGTFGTAVVETWADRTGRQWRSQITYPDGSTYDSIYQGSAIYPSASFERGTVNQPQLGCANDSPDDHAGHDMVGRCRRHDHRRPGSVLHQRLHRTR